MSFVLQFSRMRARIERIPAFGAEDPFPEPGRDIVRLSCVRDRETGEAWPQLLF